MTATRLSNAEWQARTERLAAARAAAEARMPAVCPRCGADGPVQLFDPSHRWYSCESCPNVWEA